MYDEIANIISIEESGYSDQAHVYNIHGFVSFMEEIYIQEGWELPVDENFEEYWQSARGLDGYGDNWDNR